MARPFAPSPPEVEVFGLDRSAGQEEWVDEHDTVTNHAAKPAAVAAVALVSTLAAAVIETRTPPAGLH